MGERHFVGRIYCYPHNTITVEARFSISTGIFTAFHSPVDTKRKTRYDVWAQTFAHLRCTFVRFHMPRVYRRQPLFHTVTGPIART